MRIASGAKNLLIETSYLFEVARGSAFASSHLVKEEPYTTSYID